MLQHLVKFRREELISTEFAGVLNLTKELVGPPKEYNTHGRSILVPAKHINLRNLVADAIKSLYGFDAARGKGDQDEGDVDSMIISKSGSSSEISFLSLGQKPCVLSDVKMGISIAVDPCSLPMPLSMGHHPLTVKDERIGLSVALSYQDRHSMKSRQLDQTYQTDCTQGQKKLALQPDHYFPLLMDGSLPISFLGLGAKSGIRADKRLDNYDGSDSEDGSKSMDKSNSSSWCEKYINVAVVNTEEVANDMVNIIKAYEEFPDFSDPGVLGNGEIMSCHQGKGFLLLMEHNFLCGAFIILTTYSGFLSMIPQYNEVFPWILHSLNKIWILPEWRSEYLPHLSRLSCLFSDERTVKMVYNMVMICEEMVKFCGAFKECKTGTEYKCFTVVHLLQLFLPLLLQLLQCVQPLLKATITNDLSEELESSDNEETLERETVVLLEGIRDRGYNVIGLCACVEDLFPMLHVSSVSATFTKDLESMEFEHIRKLIHLIVIPLVKNCPCIFWNEWVDSLLKLLLGHCEKILHLAWFSFLYHGRAEMAYYFGKLSGSEENRKKMEQDILLDITREVSSLVGLVTEIALLHDNWWTIPSQDMQSLSSTSFFRHLILHNCFGRMRMGLFGYLVDDKAAAGAITFCRMWLAIDSNDLRLKIFILDELLPCVIRCLDNQLPCAIQRLKCKLRSNASDSCNTDLVALCRELYNWLNNGFLESKVPVGESRNGNGGEDEFIVWLEKQKKELQLKAYSAAKELPKGYNWNWEFEDEFQRYLPAYIDMLQEVDAMDGLEHHYMDGEVLLKKLKPEFRSKYAINSCDHPYMSTISSICQRKYLSISGVIRSRQIGNVLHKLIKLRPFIKGLDRSSDVIKRLQQNSEILGELLMRPSVEILLDSILFFWEPRFHPIIREGHMLKLLQIVDRLTKAKECDFKPLLPATRVFLPHLQPYSCLFFKTKLKESVYHRAKQQVRLHEEFDKHLSLGRLDDSIDQFMSSKEDYVKELIANKKLPEKFSVLEYDLIKLSLERRAEIVQMQQQISTYSICLQGLLQNELMKHQLESLISELEENGFFDVDNDHIDWGNKYFLELVDRFNDKVFSGHSLPKHSIRGIIDFRTILLQKCSDWRCVFEEVVIEVCNGLTAYLPQFWRDTRFYEHRYYDIMKEPLKQIT